MLKKRSSRHAISQTNTAFIVIGTIIIVFGIISIIFWSGASNSDGIFGSTVGSGNLVTEDKTFNDFSIMDIGSGFQVEITQSSSYSIRITADDNVIDNILVTKNGDTLEMGLDRRTFGILTLRAEITMPDITEIHLSGGTHVTVKEFSSLNNILLKTSGGSRIDFEGSANNLIIDASGGSLLELGNLAVHDANVELSGGSRATIKVDNRLDADINGGSNLSYSGEPILGTIENSIGYTITKK